MPVESILLEGRKAWLKAYEEGDARRVSLGVLDAIARGLGIGALRPPPHPGGETACRIESRRLSELQSLGVRVPEVLGGGATALVLSDLGGSLAGRLAEAGDDTARIDALTRRAIDAMARAHAGGAYFGQPLPRNITVSDAGAVGFIDFEEDPLDVMSLREAQTRDWLMFAFGMARYYESRPMVLAGMLGDVFRSGPAEIGEQARHAGRRLDRIARLSRWMRGSARHVATSVLVLQAATTTLVLFFAVLTVDFLMDGDLDLLHFLQ